MVTTPPEEIEVLCPNCGVRYQDWYRPSINLQLDNFDEEYLRKARTATCPACNTTVDLAVLIVHPDGLWRIG